MWRWFASEPPTKADVHPRGTDYSPNSRVRRAAGDADGREEEEEGETRPRCRDEQCDPAWRVIDQDFRNAKPGGTST